MRNGICACGIAVVTVCGQAHAQDVVTETQLVVAAMQVRTFKPKDEFDVAPVPKSMAGKIINIVSAPIKSELDAVCGGFPRWQYLPNSTRFDVRMSSGSASIFDYSPLNSPPIPRMKSKLGSGHKVEFLNFECQAADSQNSTFQNAYGASVEVKVIREDSTAIIWDDESADLKEIDWSASIDGDTARRLSANVRVRIIGTLMDWPDGRSVVCAQRHIKPRMTFRYDFRESICLFYGRVDRVEFFDAQSGAILLSRAK